MSPYAGAFACVCAATAVLAALCWLVRRERDGIRWRRLVKIAGSEEAALLVVEDARIQRDLDDALMVKRRGKVLPFRLTNRGQPVRFEGPGDAA